MLGEKITGRRSSDVAPRITMARDKHQDAGCDRKREEVSHMMETRAGKPLDMMTSDRQRRRPSRGICYDSRFTGCIGCVWTDAFAHQILAGDDELLVARKRPFTTSTRFSASAPVQREPDELSVLHDIDILGFFEPASRRPVESVSSLQMLP